MENMIGWEGKSIRNENDNSEMMHRVCKSVCMSVANTYFPQKDVLKVAQVQKNMADKYD